MTEQQYLSCLHYQMITGSDAGEVIPMPVPIVLPVTEDVNIADYSTGGWGRGRFRKGKQGVLGFVRGIIMLLKEKAKVKAKIEGKSAIALKKESGEVATSRLSV